MIRFPCLGFNYTHIFELNQPNIFIFPKIEAYILGMGW